MVLDDNHIGYLRLVASGVIRIWWNPTKTISRYVNKEWFGGSREINQTVAAQMKALGMTHVVVKHGFCEVELTTKGEGVLLEEDEAWA